MRGGGRPDHKGGDWGDGCEGIQAASACFSEGRRGLEPGKRAASRSWKDKEVSPLLALPPPKE